MKAKIIVLAFIVSCVLAPIVSAGNIVSNEGFDDRYEADFPTVWTQVTLDSEITEYLCGYSLDRNTPGDCDGMNSTDAPGERWFKFIIPQNSSGNIFDFTITNLDDPDYVDLSINLCKSNIYYSSKFICKEYEDMYSNVVQEIRVSPVITSEYWIHIMAWDEEKEGRNEGGDLTQIKVEVVQIASSNSDFTEPREISFNEDIQYSNYREFEWETICAIECDEGPDDPYDIFAVRGFKGDIVELRFGSQEGHSNSDYGVQVIIQSESDFFATNFSFTFHELDDSCSASSSSESCTSIVNHHFEQSGFLFIRFYSTQGDDSFGGEEVEEYWISINYSTASQRDYFADLDGDGMADYHEYECGSEFRDSDSIAPDMDGDFTCDSFDFDIDGDGMPNDEEERCGSNPFSVSDTAPDNDLDSFCDQFDDDDDNDGMSDLEEERCGSNPLNASNTAPNYDGDSECDQFDKDDDNDGMSDIEEERCGSNPRNSLDTAPNYDGDSECDQFDKDDDNDDIIDLIDDCPYSDIYYILVDFDLDSDGCFNQEDLNIDGDLYQNLEDDCQYEFGNSTGTWRGCPDSDGDGVPDFLELDSEDSAEVESWSIFLDMIQFVGILIAGLIVITGSVMLGKKSRPLFPFVKQSTIGVTGGFYRITNKMVKGIGKAGKKRKASKASPSPNPFYPHVPRPQVTKKCSNCGGFGHNKRTCPKLKPKKQISTQQLPMDPYKRVEWKTTPNKNQAKAIKDNKRNQDTQILYSNPNGQLSETDKSDISQSQKNIEVITTGFSIVTIDLKNGTVTKEPKDKSCYEMFNKEIDNLKKLERKGVEVYLLDSQKKPAPMIVFERRGTHKLTEIIGETNNDVNSKLIKRLIDFVVSIHKAGFVHRDLKPDNILVKKHPKGKHTFETIIDYGITMKVNGRQKDYFNTAGTMFFSHKSQKLSEFHASYGQDWFSVARIIALILRGKDVQTLDAEIQQSPDGLLMRNQIENLKLSREEYKSTITKMIELSTDSNCDDNETIATLELLCRDFSKFT